MQYLTRQPVVKNKLFIAALVLAILCSLTSISLFFYMVAHLDSCITINACSEESSGYYSFCVKDGSKYCCGGWGSDTYSCGSYYNNCRKKGNGYIDCQSTFKAEIAMSWISLFFWVCMIVILCVHRKRQDRLQMAPENYSLMTQNNNQNVVAT